MATSTIFNFNFNNSEIVDSTGQWYDASTGTPTIEFINHDGNTALLQRAYTTISGTTYMQDINPVFFQSRDPTFTAHTYTIELQIYPLRDSGEYGPWDGPVLAFNPDTADEENWVGLNTIQQRASESNTFYWREYGLGPDGGGIPFLTVTAADGTYNRWYSIRIERVDDGTNTGATIKIYVDGTMVVNETLTYLQDARRGRIGDSIRYTYRGSSTDPRGAGVAIDNFKLTAGIAPSSVVDVSLANLQRNNANLLSFIKGKVPTVNDGTLTIKVNGTTAGTFTANQSTNATANIQCVDLTNAQTIGGDKEFIGTTTAHDLVPSATDTYNFGSSSVQWNNAYIKSLTINGVACGDILTHNASEFVDLSSNQIIGGEKTFSNSQTGFGRDICCYSNRKYGNNLNPTANTYQYLIFSGNTVSDGPGNNWNGGYIEQFTNTSGGSRGRWFIQDTSGNTVALELWASSNDKQIRPYRDNDTILGAANRRWKDCYTNAINGINPGALSLPSGTVGMNLIGDVSVVDTEKKLSKDITVTGYVYVDVSFTSSNRLNLYNDTKKYGIWIPCDSGKICQIMPISAGDRLEFNVLDDGSTINAIQLFTCQGNV